MIWYTCILIKVWILPMALGFGLQNSAMSTFSGTLQSRLPRSEHLSGPLMLFRSTLPTRFQSQHYYYHSRSSRFMKPFWKSSSSSDNERNNKKDEDGKDEEDVPKLPSQEASATGSGVNSVTEGLPATNTAPETSTTTTSNREREGILDLIDDVGQSFKPLAEKATAKGYQAETQTKKVLYAVKACAYYMLFILYRAYRGLFVLVPAVFRQVYRKMELAMNSDLALEDDVDDDDYDAVADTSSSTTPEKVSWRTKVTVSILASVVTMSYVFGAAVKMITKFVRTATKSRSIPKSFEAAADELVIYEDRVSRIGKINGDNKMEPGGFAP
ncbi:hypothetical protein IV203_034779 [Nitzschia inconspicua]|uniref:Uncharacterized protein n=1 Tax=Nitzschia inconspicua TaxID=303405 RepID=A0A9K3PUA3_9STRA|nr:hypothetical protein IV203_034779 [Nitzschia inconspicua]